MVISNYVAVQAASITVLALFAGLLLIVRYAKIGRRTLRAKHQHELFRIRDEAVYLIASGQLDQSNQYWRAMYAASNHCATAANIDEMQSGFHFVMHLLASAPSEPIDLADIVNCSPEPIKQLWLQWLKSVVQLIWEGSFVIRMVLRLAKRLHAVKEIVLRFRPVESKRAFRLFETAHQLKLTGC